MNPGNRFRALWDAGFQRLVPVVPPDAVVSERSTLFRGLGTSKDPRGKAPGVRGPNGWHSFQWTNYEPDERDLERWHAMGAGVGIKTGEQADGTWLVGIDADTLAAPHAMSIAAHVYGTFGADTPTRIGRAPKALYVVRLDGPYRYSRDEFDDGVSYDDQGRATARVEFLSDGKQFVASGIHPTTRAPYSWTVPLRRFADLPVLSAAEFV